VNSECKVAVCIQVWTAPPSFNLFVILQKHPSLLNRTNNVSGTVNSARRNDTYVYLSARIYLKISLLGSFTLGRFPM
jgi:hypothetical protein